MEAYERIGFDWKGLCTSRFSLLKHALKYVSTLGSLAEQRQRHQRLQERFYLIGFLAFEPGGDLSGAEGLGSLLPRVAQGLHLLG